MEEADVECQTDAFLDRPPTPLFVPAKTGVDNTTQILDGEVRLTFLFHFWGMILIITEQSEEMICKDTGVHSLPNPHQYV